MQFTDGFWLLRPGVAASYAEEVYRIDASEDRIEILAPTRRIDSRGDTLNLPLLTICLDSPLEGVIRVRIDHHKGRRPVRGFDLPGATGSVGRTSMNGDAVRIQSGELAGSLRRGSPWNLVFEARGRVLSRSPERSIAMFTVAHDAALAPLRRERLAVEGARGASTHIVQRLSLGVGELVYGLGERFGPFVKNGQSIEVWNADAGTSSEQAYKNVPFYLTNRGYGILVNHGGLVSFEIGSEQVERVQFSVEGEGLEYFVIDGPTPKDVLDRYTQLTGRPGTVPTWSYGPWLSTSFTTDYDEATVTSFLDGMDRHGLPVSVFHFDCFWMRELQWVDLAWDPVQFPDPQGMIARLHARGLRVSVWVNPYVAQQSVMFREGADEGYFVRRNDGSIWQWDMWQPGMAIIDFTNPAAVNWFQAKLSALLEMGVDAFKTDFGERVPLAVTYFDGSDPEAMHNRYPLLYNRVVHEVLSRKRGATDAVVFARSGTVGSQSMPVHWGGDSTSTFESMAESLRGGLSLAMSGFAHWSHDIGGFEGTPDGAVFKRWTAFGMLSSHSRYHGSDSYRVPWAFDEEAVRVAGIFSRLKLRLLPYLVSAGVEATQTGVPVLRPMALEFPDDPAVGYLDRQYLLGGDILVAPVFDLGGEVDLYIPAGTWTSLLTGSTVVGPSWRREVHGYESLPLYVREGACIPWGARDDVADYDVLDNLTLVIYPGPSGHREFRIAVPDGRVARFRVDATPNAVRVSGDPTLNWSARLPEGPVVRPRRGTASLVLSSSR